MTITIDLPEDTLANLNERAQAQGRPAAELVAEVVTERFGADHGAEDFPLAQGRPAAELVAEVVTERFGADHGAEDFPLDDDALEKIRRGFEDMDAGRTVPLEASRSRIEALLAARHGNGST